jgi:hypothetical protein
MSEAAVSEGPLSPKAPGITLRKQIVPFEESTPAEEPLFINCAQVAYAGGCAYIDVGVIPLDEIVAPSSEATFLVLNRLVMSKETMVALRDQITKLLEGVEENAGASQNTP